MINLVVLQGVLARPAQDRVLPSGGRLLTLEVTVSRPDGPAEPTPVAWFDAPAWAATLDEGAEVVVVGRVRRRFFRAGGITQSRTEVVASRVVRAAEVKRARAAMAAAGTAVETAAAALGGASAAVPNRLPDQTARRGRPARHPIPPGPAAELGSPAGPPDPTER